MVEIMAALWFELPARPRTGSRSSRTPRPSCTRSTTCSATSTAGYLTTLREFGGLQSYPSRIKDPDTVDFSTGSVGIGATAPLWGALAHRYVAGQFEVARRRPPDRLLGDAELDEGAIWEAVADPTVARLGELLWVVDLNRQSLDRVVPDIPPTGCRACSRPPAGRCVTLKCGRLARELFERPGGEALRRRIDEMPNEEYQRLLRADRRTSCASACPGAARGRRELGALVGELPDDELPPRSATSAATTSALLLDAFARPTRRPTGPRSCSPTRSRAAGCRPRAIPTTTPRC